MPGQVLVRNRHQSQLRADRGRLVRRIEAWDARCATAYTAACCRRILEIADRARSTGAEDARMAAYRADAQRFAGARDANVAGWVAARAAAALEGPKAYRDERARQAGWLAARLELDRRRRVRVTLDRLTRRYRR